jgi:hypothetical protein
VWRKVKKKKEQVRALISVEGIHFSKGSGEFYTKKPYGCPSRGTIWNPTGEKLGTECNSHSGLQATGK